MTVPSWLKLILQPVVDEAVNMATQQLVGSVNREIDNSKIVPTELKDEIKLLIDGPILAWKVKL